MNYLHRPIMIVGEAWGSEEAYKRTAFVGHSGQELRRMLADADIPLDQCWLTNIFNERPPGKDNYSFLSKKRASGHAPDAVLPQYLHHLTRFKDEINAVEPNIIVAAGAISNWFLTGGTSISADRGTLSHCTLVEPKSGPPYKVLPTYHPAAILRRWTLRPTAVADLAKAKRHSGGRELELPRRVLIIDPTEREVLDFLAELHSAPLVSFDIETSREQITHISFAGDPYLSICIPFYVPEAPQGSYWPDAATETRIWLAVRGLLENPRVPKLAQNGLYDIQYLWAKMRIRTLGFCEDTSILHHTLFPELPKALGYLGSIYAEDMSWKHMRQKRRAMTETKRDE